MANPVSPLHPLRQTGQFGNKSAPGVTLQEIPNFGMLQFATWGDTFAETSAEAARVAGCDTAPNPGQFNSGDNGILMRVEPLKWWLISSEGTEVPQSDLPPEHGAVLDMRQSRCWLRIGGERAETLLNHFLPLDLSPAVFGAGTVASTAFHHVGVTLWRDDAGYNLLLPRSSAVSLWELMSESARQYGLVEI